MIDIKVTCECAHVEVESSKYSLHPSGRVTVTLDDADLVNNVSVEDIVNEYDHSELLDAIPEHVVIQHVVSNNDPSTFIKKYGADEMLDEIGEKIVIAWLENNGYTVEQ